MVSNLLYYVLYASAVVVYGIGLERESSLSRTPRYLVLDGLKMLITVSATSTLSYLVISRLLVPHGLAELFPFICVLVFAMISVFVESIIRITARISMAEYTVSILCVLLGVNESVSLAECVLNSIFCVAAFFAFLPVLYAVRKRTELSHPMEDFQNLSLLFLSFAIVLVILLTWNVSWLNPGVFQ